MGIQLLLEYKQIIFIKIKDLCQMMNLFISMTVVIEEKSIENKWKTKWNLQEVEESHLITMKEKFKI